MEMVQAEGVHKDMAKAAEAMRNIGAGGTVKNMSTSKRRSVAIPFLHNMEEDN